MIKLILDPKIGDKSLSYTFKKEQGFSGAFSDVVNKLEIAKELQPDLVLVIVKTGSFAGKIDELSKYHKIIVSLNDNDEVMIRSIKEEAKASTEKLTMMLNDMADNPGGIDSKTIQEFEEYLNTLYKNYQVLI